MKEETVHENNTSKIVEHYNEEGILTIETLDSASLDATTLSHKKHTTKSFVLTTPIAIIIAGILISLGILGYGLITRDNNSSSKTTLFLGEQLQAGEYIDGKEDSKIIVIEYSDPECPYCVQVAPTIQKLRDVYKDKVAFSYRHFPLTQIHSHAFDEARAISCAGVVGGSKKYYEYIDTFFEYKLNRKTTQLPATGKEDFARSIGLDMSAFTKCMKDNQTEKVVIDSINDGVTAGVQGTPSTFILQKTRKGYEIISMVDGARPYEFFEAIVEEALSR